MRLWIVEEGKKQGPFEVYELRNRIENDELTGEELAWHKDCDDWVALKELDVFSSEFEAPKEIEAAAPPPLPKNPRPFLRFAARSFDLGVYWLILYGGMRVVGADILAAALSPLFNQLSMLPFLILEAGALHLWRTTPGKALLGIRVETVDGEACRVGTAILRTVRVYIIGLGLLQPILFLLCGGFSLWFTLRNGRAPWDALARLEVRTEGLHPGRVITFVMVFAIILILLLFGIFGPLAIEYQQGFPSGDRGSS